MLLVTFYLLDFYTFLYTCTFNNGRAWVGLCNRLSYSLRFATISFYFYSITISFFDQGGFHALVNLFCFLDSAVHGLNRRNEMGSSLLSWVFVLERLHTPALGHRP
jgi:hypothetical protein